MKDTQLTDIEKELIWTLMKHKIDSESELAKDLWKLVQSLKVEQ